MAQFRLPLGVGPRPAGTSRADPEEALVTAADQMPATRVGVSAFDAELRLRVEEARTALAAAEAMGDALLAQIAEADLADLRALAARNDVDLP